MKAAHFLFIILFLQFIHYLSVFTNIPVVRQLFGFAYLTFVPGFVALKILRLKDLNCLETMLFSAGLGIAFLIVVGLLINEFAFLIGILQPLSLVTLVVVLNSLILTGGVLVVLSNKSVTSSINVPKGFPPALLFALLPFLSIAGTTWVRTYDSNLVLLLMIVAIALLFALGVVSKRFLSPKLYPFAIFMISISLLYHSALISDNLISFGSDVPGEVFALKIVQRDGHWYSTNPYGGDSSLGRTYAMLSVTILPLIYSNLLDLNSIWVFKLIYPMILSLIPLGLYSIWSKYVGDKYAFVSAFLFMAYQTFYGEMLGLSKQIIGELFMVLLLLVILKRKEGLITKTALFVIFSFCLVVSHYALAEIFLFVISFALVALIIIKRAWTPSRDITLSMIFLFFAIMFSWYIFTSGSSVFNSFLSFSQNIYDQLGEFSNPGSRGATVLRGLGLEAPPSIWNTIGRAFAYLTQIFVVVGFIYLILRRKRFLHDLEYFVCNLFAVLLLVALVLVPGLANTMNMTRFYHILLIFLAPLCPLGADTIVNLVGKHELEIKASIHALALILIVLVPYFLFQTGFVYEVTRSHSGSLALSKYRMSPFRPYMEYGIYDEYSVSGAQWLSETIRLDQDKVYADDFARISELRPYGGIYIGNIEVLSNATQVRAGGVVYLNRLNTVGGIVVGVHHSFNTSELRFLQDLNCAYSNGGSILYKNTEPP